MMLLAGILIAAQLAASGSIERGRDIYTRGLGAEGLEIEATMGDGAADVPAALLPCANCHGYDGRGNSEGGVVPPNVRWSELTKPYAITATNGRRRPPYDERSFARAMIEGLDSAGHQLSNVMPKYRMSPQQISDLIAYVRVLGVEKTNGVAPAAIRLAATFPAQGEGARAGALISRVLSSYFAERGEIHGRRVVVDSIPLARSDRRAIEEAFGDEPPLTIVAPLMAGDAALTDFATTHRILLLTPMASASAAAIESRFRLSLYAGIVDQARSLMQFVSARTGVAQPMVLVDSTAVRPALERDGARVVDSIDTLERVPDAVLIADPVTRIDDWLARLDQRAWHPYILLTSAAIPPKPPVAPNGFHGKVFAAVPALPSDPSASGLAEFREFARRNNLAREGESMQRYAYAAARLLEKALVDSGRDLRGEVLISSLEKIYRFDTGVTRPVTFTPSQHVGTGASIVEIDGSRITTVARN